MFRTREEIEQSDMNEAVKKQLLAKWDGEDSEAAQSSSPPEVRLKPTKKDKQLEKQLQEEVEGLLHHAGYWRRSPAFIRAGEKPPRGWQIHLHKPIGNPILLDILVLDHNGKYCELELKRPGGVYSSLEQEILCEDHGLPVFVDAVNAYEYVKAELQKK